MIKTRKTLRYSGSIFYLGFILLVSGTTNSWSQEKTETDIPLVTVCRLNSLGRDYDGKIVRVKGTYVQTFEGQSLTDKSCKKALEISFDCKTASQCAQLTRPIDEKIVGNIVDGQMADVVVVGVVKYIPVGKNQNALPIQLFVQRVECVSRLKSIGGPWDSFQKEKRSP